MPDQVEDEVAVEEPARAWRPSGRPVHTAGAEGKIVEVGLDNGWLGRLREFFKRPFVRLVTGLGIFILAAIVYDTTVNYREWTIKKEELKPASHKGVDSGSAPVPVAPR